MMQWKADPDYCPPANPKPAKVGEREDLGLWIKLLEDRGMKAKSSKASPAT